MTIIEDLLLPNPRWRDGLSLPGMDPLTENGSLQEAQLLEVRFDAVRSTAGLLFDLRGALQLREANTGVLILRGVQTLSWLAGPRETGRTAWTVGGSTVTGTDRLFVLEVGLWPVPGALLTVSAEVATFLAGDVPGLDRIADYTDDDEPTLRGQTASWQSEFEPVCVSVYPPAPPGST